MPHAKAICTAADYWAPPEDVHAELIDGELWDLAAPKNQSAPLSWMLWG